MSEHTSIFHALVVFEKGSLARLIPEGWIESVLCLDEDTDPTEDSPAISMLVCAPSAEAARRIVDYRISQSYSQAGVLSVMITGVSDRREAIVMNGIPEEELEPGFCVESAPRFMVRPDPKSYEAARAFAVEAFTSSRDTDRESVIVLGAFGARFRYPGLRRGTQRAKRRHMPR